MVSVVTRAFFWRRYIGRYAQDSTSHSTVARSYSWRKVIYRRYYLSYITVITCWAAIVDACELLKSINSVRRCERPTINVVIFTCIGTASVVDSDWSIINCRIVDEFLLEETETNKKSWFLLANEITSYIAVLIAGLRSTRSGWFERLLLSHRHRTESSIARI